MQLDLERVRANAEKSTTEDLLDRVTVFRGQMEPDAVEVIEQVLRQRGVGLDRIDAYSRKAAEGVVRLPDGSAATCSFCSRAAVSRGWGWHRWRGRIPLFPRPVRYCPGHLPKKKQPPAAAAAPTPPEKRPDNPP